MDHAIAHFVAGEWPAGDARDSVTLDFDTRHRRRLRLTTDAGNDVLLDLKEARAMADGDGLRLADGGWIAVRAAPEDLLEVRCAEPHLQLRVAWHLGNRHLAAEIHPDRILIRPDHVIEAMLQGLGAEVRHVRAAFQPEGGAYGGHGHSHGHGHGHDHHH